MGTMYRLMLRLKSYQAKSNGKNWNNGILE